jgi:uncharacterized repeat protein (TIGR01451 family)
MKKNNSTQKSRAQAMVEFAITLPVLLMLMYGILEAGRMLFLFSSVVTASRQAVRYGTATGSGGDFTSQGGPDNSTYTRYQDCYGIRAAANRAGFLGQFDSIDMEFDTGPSSSVTTHCTGGADFDPDLKPNNNNYRLVVTVSEQFTPLVPKLVPFLNRTFSATSARTILYRVDIVVTAPAGSGGGSGTGDLTLAVSTNPTSVNAPQTVSISYVVTNTGTTDLATPITITTDKGSWSCSGEPATLTASGGSFPCTGSYTVTQADIDSGTNVVITASATVGASSSGNETATISIVQSAALTLDKTGPDSATAQSGTVVTYQYSLRNTGNVTLTAPYAVSDSKVSTVTCASTSDLAPGASTSCDGTYTLTNPDINAGTVTNTATATARFNANTITSNSDSWTVYTPALYLTVTASPVPATSAGQSINFTYTLRNNSNSNLREPYTVSDSRVTNENCPNLPATLAPNETVTCNGSYTVTQANLDAGNTLTSTISATARKATGNATESSNTVTYNVAITQNPALNLAMSVNPATATTLNDVVTYTYTLTNNGNVTLSPTFTITDDKASGITCTDPGTAIAPGGTKTCTGTRTISQTDLDDGSVINTATATAAFGAGTVTSNSVSATVTTYVGARLTLIITANPNPATGSGQIITFTYTLRNTGNVVLSSPYTVNSTLTGSADCSSASATIAIAGSTTCVGFYTTQPGDVGTQIVDSATATAMDGAVTVTSNNATLNVPVNP